MSELSRRADAFAMPVSDRAPLPGLATDLPPVSMEEDRGDEDENEVRDDHAGGLTERHERFCRAFVATSNGARAAREAGYAETGARRQAHRLLRRPEVRRRVRDLRHAIAEDSCLDAMVLMAKLESVYRKALENHHFHAATRAVEVQSRLAGHLVDRRRVTMHDGVRDDAADGAPADVTWPGNAAK